MTCATLLFALIALPAGADRPGEPVLLDFTATWCGPCRSMRPEVEKLVEKGYPVKPVDLDANADLAARYKVTGVPTFIVVDPDGRELGRTSGAQPAINLANLYREAKSKYQASRESSSAPETGDEPGGDEDTSETRPARPNPDPWETVVRIKVHARGSIGFGSGTVIYSTPTESLILTCAHVFKMSGRPQVAPSQFPLKITIDLFDGHLTGTRPSQVHYANETFVGEAVDYDFARDVGLIRIRPGRKLPYAKVVPAHWTPKPGYIMTTVGCSEGHDASAWRTTIVNPAMKGLQGNGTYEAIECMIAPKEGRSGGGLFTSDGYVAGVCDFAEPRGNHGLYAAPASIYKMLDRNRLAFLYDDTKAPDRLMADNGGTSNASEGRIKPIPVRQRLQSPENEGPPPVTLPPPDMLGIKAPVVAAADRPAEAQGRPATSSRRQSWHPSGSIPRGSIAIPTEGSLDPSLDPDRFNTRKPVTDPKPADDPTPVRTARGKWHAGRSNIEELVPPGATEPARRGSTDEPVRPAAGGPGGLDSFGPRRISP